MLLVDRHPLRAAEVRSCELGKPGETVHRGRHRLSCAWSD
ncbi:hypothetical protein T261_08011 [Streptomyces lydicus]|nr:hypothetical protein T261_08011 [Streptomyces lydicus]